MRFLPSGMLFRWAVYRAMLRGSVVEKRLMLNAANLSVSSSDNVESSTTLQA